VTAECGSAAGDGRAVGVRCVTCDGVPGSPRNVGNECCSCAAVDGDGIAPGVMPGVMPGVTPGVVPGVIRVGLEGSANSIVAGDGGTPAGVKRVKTVGWDGVPAAALAVSALGVGG